MDSQFLHMISAVALGLPILSFTTIPGWSAAAEADGAASASSKDSKKASLIDASPGFLSQLERYPKYYGDRRTDPSAADDPLLERRFLLGSLGGSRD